MSSPQGPQAVNAEYEDDGDTLVSKTEHLLRAAADNDLETLKQLLDSPEWYNVRDESGNSLLHTAISRRNDEVFDYLLSLDDFPLDSINDEGHTALDCVLRTVSYGENENHPPFPFTEVYERYATELIKKEANTVSYDGRHLLHSAAYYDLPKMARLLIERGADLNELDDRSTALHFSVYNMFESHSPEIVTMLLCYGADPSILDMVNYTAFDLLFEKMMFDFASSDMFVLENLIFFTFDKWNSFQFIDLLALAHLKSPLFYQVIKLDCEILFENSLKDADIWCDLFCIDSEYLRILLEKYPDIVKYILDFSKVPDCRLPYIKIRNFDVKKINMLIQNSVCSDSCIELFSKLSESGVIIDLVRSGKDKDETIELIYYFLSYGMILNELDLEYIYEITGYSQDFKNFLHMDFQNQDRVQIGKMMPRLIYDITLDIHKIVENLSLCDFIDWKDIFHYFVHPKIQNAYRQLKPDEASKRQVPQLPLLQELARDAFRKYLIKRYEIKTSRKFFTILKILRTRYQMFSHIIEKIITYESKLYYFVN